MQYMVQDECEKCEDRGEIHGISCIVRKLIFERDFHRKPHVSRRQAMDAAVLALEQYIQKQKEKNMNPIAKTETTSLTLAGQLGLSDSQLDLVKRTVAKNATNDELELFFYRCKELQLNPLMPGQVYFLKFKNRKTGEWNPGTVIVGLDGFRARAQRTGKLAGIKRGVIRNDKGQCIGGWADIYRKDWDHPAHEEVALNEYKDDYKDTWRDMPETMIKKVAEVAALRMAFPEELGGVYSKEEMDRVETKSGGVASVSQAETHQRTNLKPSDAQLKRLFAISRSNGFTAEELKEVLLKDYGHESTKDLNLDEYNDLCAKLEAKTIPVEKKIEPHQPGDFTAGHEITEPEVPTVEGVTNQVPWAKYRESDPRMVK